VYCTAPHRAARRSTVLYLDQRIVNNPSIAFLIRRALSSVFVVAGVALLVFVVVRLVPGDPVDAILGEQALDVDRDAMRACMRLDRTLPEQLGAYVRDIFGGTLGTYCDAPDRTVRADIVAAIGPTFQLALASLALAFVIAIPLGVLAARRHRTWVDVVALLVALLGMSIPNFWLGPMLLILFALSLSWLPAPGAGYTGWVELILPTITLATALSAKLTRMTRSAMLEVLSHDYVRAARAKGLSETVVVYKHALRNAMIPVVSVLGMQLGGLLTGAIIVEKVFARPGLGMLLLDAITQRNYALVQGCVLVIATIYVCANLATDVAYTWVDPRVRQEEER